MKRRKKVKVAKGDRLKWIPKNAVVPATLTIELMKGRRLTDEDLSQAANFNNIPEIRIVS